MTAFERWSVWITSILTGATGIALGWMKYLLKADDPWAVVNHPLQPLVLKLHIIASPLLVFAIGLITLRHIWPHIRSRVVWGRRSGYSTALVVAPMVVTGYLIQAVTHHGWLVALTIAHVGGGVFYLVGLGIHQLIVPGHVRDARRAAGNGDSAGTQNGRERPAGQSEASGRIGDLTHG